MSWFRPKRSIAPGFAAGERLLWIKNTSAAGLRVMLEPWCDAVDVPPGQWARLTATFDDDRDEYDVHYSEDTYLGVYCPPGTTIEVVEVR